MIIYEDESLVIPVGLGNNSTDDSKRLQTKNVTITENTTTQVTPDSNYIGLSRVSITTDIPTEIHNQQKDEVVHANTTKIIYPDSGYTGLSRVNVTAKADLQDKFAKISQGGVTNITYDEGFDGLNSVEVFVDVPLGKIEFDSSTNVQRVVTDSSGYCDITVNPYTVKDVYIDSSTSPQVIRPTDTDAFNNIYINQLSLDPLTINPSKSMQVFQGAYDFVQVHPVTSSIDSNIVPENIRKDTTILGVRGTLEAIGEKEELTVDSSTSTQVYTPSEGSAGFSKVTVNGYTDCYTKLFEAAPLDAPINDFGPQTISITADNLRGLKNLGTHAFSHNYGMWINKFYDITFPDTLESLRSYPFIDNMYHTIDFYDANIINWPGPFEDMATAYPQFFESTISSIVFPRKMRGFISRSSYVINKCTIDTIDLNPCQNLYNIDKLVTNSTVKSIIIPASCGEIKHLASNCTQLTSIYCYAEIPPRAIDIVYNIGTEGVLHVPSGSKERYEQSGWMLTGNQYSIAHYGWTIVEDL